MASTSDKPSTKVGIISLGDMGSGIARLLVAKGFTVATNCMGRSQDTIDRAKTAGAILLPTDAALVAETDIIFSVVPPRDALATAQRIVAALDAGARPPSFGPLYFADLNAVAPSTIKSIAALFAAHESSGAVRFIDGSIIGPPPSPPPSPSDEASTTTTIASSSSPSTIPAIADPTTTQDGWKIPQIPTSGPYSLADAFPDLSAALQPQHISPAIGAASGLKMCFASLSKGYTAIAIQAFTSAAALGVLPELRAALGRSMPPGRLAQTERSVVNMVPKAYRWVREMEEIGKTHAEEGGFVGGSGGGKAGEKGFGEGLFAGAAGVFEAVAQDEVLGREKVGKRVRGTSAEEVATLMAEGLARKRKKTE